jgi:outer membrane protein, multidrug efflux system
MIKSVSFLVLVVLLFACKTSKDALQTDIAIPEKYSTEAKSVNVDTLRTLARVAVPTYAQFFKDPLLVALIDTAVRSNPDLRIANARVQQSRSGVAFTRGIRLPELGFAASSGVRKFGDYTIDGVGNYDTQFSPNLTPDQQLPNPVPDYFGGVYTTWEIDLWGKLKNQKKAALNRFLASEQGRNLVLTDLVAEVAKKYYFLVLLDREMKIIEESIGLQENALLLVQAQMESGKATELGIELITAQVLQAKNLLLEVEQQIIENENALNLLLGRYPQTIRRGDFAASKLLMNELNAGIPAHLLNRRPDIVLAELELRASNADVNSAKAAFYPTLQLSGTMGLQTFRAALFFEAPASLAYSVAGGLVMPLLNRRALKAQLMQSKGQQKEAYISYEKTILNAFTEVYGLLRMRANFQQMTSTKSDEVQVLERSVTTSKALYTSGRSTYLEIITAQSNYLHTQIELLNIYERSNNNQIQLYKALGGGF